MPKWARVGKPISAAYLALLFLTLGAASPPAAPADFPDVYRLVKPSVVFVLSWQAGGALASGSGFIYDSDATQSIIVTAAHVIANEQHVDVILDSDKSKRYAAKVLESDLKRDVAFLSIPVANRKPLRLADRDQIIEGTTVASVGYPQASVVYERLGSDALRPTVHLGIISAVRINGEVIQFDAATDHGDSGGPVIDSKTGRVIGIVRGSLLDPTYAAHGIVQVLPGTSLATSSTVIYGVRNGLITSAQPSPSPGVVANVGEGGAYRVGFAVVPTLPITIPLMQTYWTKYRTHFTADNALYAIPISAPTSIFGDDTQRRTVCDDQRLNALLNPIVTWSFKDGTLNAVAGMLIEDCAGVPYYGHVVRGARNRLRGVTLPVLNDLEFGLIADLLKDFDTYRAAHQDTWLTLLKTGAGLGSPADHVLATIAISDGEYRIRNLSASGLGVKVGLKEGDLIATIDGQPIPPGSLYQEVSLLLDTARTVDVKRPEGTVSIKLR
jgi:hypothetical protein